MDEYKGDTREGKYQLIIADGITRELLDILPNRYKNAIKDYLQKHGQQIEVVIMDMSPAFKATVQKALGKPIIVADRFHFCRYIYCGLDRVRRRVQQNFHDYDRKNERQLKWAAFPAHTTLEMYNLNEQQTLSQKQLKQLSELTWIDQLYNLVLLGPAGVGKTHLATALGIKAVHQGYQVMFITMEELIRHLKAEEFTRKAQIRMKRIRAANLVIIDDLMFMAMDQREANLFFHLINDLHDKASIILTSNKGPSEWGDLLGDQGITTAILDRILHRVEVIQFQGEDNHRMKNRTSIFKEESVQN
ncbi:IS21-like element helper ATPase IstB [Amphibacillus jilinensis]|uniref:IS21-like element helper ATPase IstB n=2 Tax=Amphibacillus jilinensis TaxID=1216008 RepID=UPI0002DE1E20|nr:IS21-like element helper ATPase IstB [Amphibacillus jilinensis]